MGKASRESRLNAAFVMVADTLTADYDVVDLLHTLVNECTDIVAAQAGGLMLVNSGGNLQVVASTRSPSRTLPQPPTSGQLSVTRRCNKVSAPSTRYP